MKVLLVLLCGVNIFAAQERGGGSRTELNFVEIARYALAGIQDSIRQSEGLFDGMDIAAFQKAIEATEIFAVQSLCYSEVDGKTGIVRKRCLDAQYIPSLNRIEVSEDAWWTKLCRQRMGIAVHEFGRASGNENGNYKFSSKVVASHAIFNQCDRHGVDLPDINPPPHEVTCNTKVKYLEEMLREYDSLDTSTELKRADYIVSIRSVMAPWNDGYGKECREESEQTCLKVCRPKVQSQCLPLCIRNLK